MNLSEALNAALPELPVNRVKQKRFPRLDPRMVAREQVHEGDKVFIAHVPGTGNLYRFTPLEWMLLQHFDGVRSYAEVAESFFHETGIRFTEAEIREFADGRDSFWYQTPQERSIALQQQLAGRRCQHAQKKSRFGDISHITFSAWDPDRYLTRLCDSTRWLYSKWFHLATLPLFVFMLYVFVVDFGRIGADTIQYYTFTDKGFTDLAEFWILFLVLAFFHESAHGLTCKYYGGSVNHMGFHLIYLLPAFFVDVTEVYVYANRWQRLITIMAGIWIEMLFCAVATVVWWGTPPGTWAHEFCYKVMLITGVAVVVVNMNPLIKLDGYYALSEITGISDIKEKSTAFVSTWVKRHVFGLPVEVEWVPRRRRWIYVPYAILSGIYSYSLLLFVCTLAGNIFAAYSPEWAFVPSVLVFLLIFRSRLVKLWRFMHTVYLDKKERMRAWLRGPRLVASAAALALVLLLPVWPHSVQARFSLEPVQRAVLRTSVAGRVLQVNADEGATLQQGATIATLENLTLESEASKAAAELALVTARASQARLQYANYGSAEREREQLAQQSALLREQVQRLHITAPFTGTVLTPRMRDLAGRHLPEGTQIVELADLKAMRARIFIPDYELRHLPREPTVKLHVDGEFAIRTAAVQSLAPAPVELEAGLAHQLDYEGIRQPRYYVATAMLANDGALRDGMSGTAKVAIGRRSLLQMVWKTSSDFVWRKLW